VSTRQRVNRKENGNNSAARGLLSGSAFLVKIVNIRKEKACDLRVKWTKIGNSLYINSHSYSAPSPFTVLPLTLSSYKGYILLCKVIAVSLILHTVVATLAARTDQANRT